MKVATQTEQESFKFITDAQAYKKRRIDSVENIEIILGDIISLVSFGDYNNKAYKIIKNLETEFNEIESDKVFTKSFLKKIKPDLIKDGMIAELNQIAEEIKIYIEDQKDVKGLLDNTKRELKKQEKYSEIESIKLQNIINKFLSAVENNKVLDIAMYNNLEQEVFSKLQYATSEDTENVKVQMFEVKKDFNNIVKYNKLLRGNK